MKPFAPLRLSSWLSTAEVGTKAPTKWLRKAPMPFRIAALTAAGPHGRRQSCDVQKGSRDLVCCIRVTASSAIIDSRAARLGESMLVDRFDTLDGPDLGPRRTVLRAVLMNFSVHHASQIALGELAGVIANTLL